MKPEWYAGALSEFISRSERHPTCWLYHEWWSNLCWAVDELKLICLGLTDDDVNDAWSMNHSICHDCDVFLFCGSHGHGSIIPLAQQWAETMKMSETLIWSRQLQLLFERVNVSYYIYTSLDNCCSLQSYLSSWLYRAHLVGRTQLCVLGIHHRRCLFICDGTSHNNDDPCTSFRGSCLSFQDVDWKWELHSFCPYFPENDLQCLYWKLILEALF